MTPFWRLDGAVGTVCHGTPWLFDGRGRPVQVPQTAPGLYPEHDLFIRQTKLKNTLRHWMGEDLITHLGAEYYEE